MKKYVIPQSETVELTAQSVLAASPAGSLSSRDEYSSGEQFADKKEGWSSDLWSGSDESAQD